MRRKLLATWLSGLALASVVPIAEAGLIRDAGKKIAKGPAVVAAKTKQTANAAADGMTAAGAATGKAVKTGTVDVAHAAKATPGVVGHATKAAAKKVWKAVW
jgi:predicted TIM-barrel enzyme